VYEKKKLILMQQTRIIVLVALGALLAVFGIITMQYMLVMVILVFVVLVLVCGDFKRWVEMLVEKLASGNRTGPAEIAGMNESMASLRDEIAHIRERLDALEETKRS
jgi:hypothetical protein